MPIPPPTSHVTWFAARRGALVVAAALLCFACSTPSTARDDHGDAGRGPTSPGNTRADGGATDAGDASDMTDATQDGDVTDAEAPDAAPDASGNESNDDWRPADGATPASGSYVYLQSQFGDYIGGGKTYLYKTSNAQLHLTDAAGHVSISVNGDEQWQGEFLVPGDDSELKPGRWEHVARYPFQDPGQGAVAWSGEGAGCNTIEGWLAIDDVTYDNDGKLATLELRFEQHCDGTIPALHGAIRWVAADSALPPGPEAPPSDLWAPAAGSTPVSGNFVYLTSDQGDFIGGGRTYSYTQADAVLSVSVAGGVIRVGVQGDEGWSADFAAMMGLTEFEIGYYADLQRYPFHNPAKGGLDWAGEGRGCNMLTGWFAIDSVTYEDGDVTAFELRFEQHCEGGAAALRGAIRWSADDPTVPPGPVTPVPTDLWKAASDAVPADGAYVYLKSDPSDYIGAGQTALYTPNDTTISVEASGAHVSVSVANWTGEFVAMTGLAQLAPGYYGDLQRYPFHNHAKGGLGWGGNGRGCNTLEGWFAVDDVSYSDQTISLLDLRFEQHCEGGVPALRGQLHYTNP